MRHLPLRNFFQYEKAGGGFGEKVILDAPGEKAPEAGFDVIPAPRTQMFEFFKMGQKILGGDFLEGSVLEGEIFQCVAVSAACPWRPPAVDHPKKECSDSCF